MVSYGTRPSRCWKIGLNCRCFDGRRHFAHFSIRCIIDPGFDRGRFFLRDELGQIAEDRAACPLGQMLHVVHAAALAKQFKSLRFDRVGLFWFHVRRQRRFDRFRSVLNSCSPQYDRTISKMLSPKSAIRFSPMPCTCRSVSGRAGRILRQAAQGRIAQHHISRHLPLVGDGLPPAAQPIEQTAIDPFPRFGVDFRLRRRFLFRPHHLHFALAVQHFPRGVVELQNRPIARRAIEQPLIQKLIDHRLHLFLRQLAHQAVSAELIVPAAANHFGFGPGEHVDHVTDAESFLDAGHAGQDFLGRLGAIFHRFHVGQANIAGAAIFALVCLTKIFHAAPMPAARRVAQPLHLLEQLQLRVDHFSGVARLRRRFCESSLPSVPRSHRNTAARIRLPSRRGRRGRFLADSVRSVFGMAVCSTQRTLLRSMPMPNATVATTTFSSSAANASCTRCRSVGFHARHDTPRPGCRWLSTPPPCSRYLCG